MRHAKRKPKLNRTGSHREAMLGNMVGSLIEKQQIRTTETKAKVASRLADQMVTLGKRGDLASRRQAYRVLKDRTRVKTLFHDIAPLFKDRKGGYTRVLRLSDRRLGDGAKMAILEFVEKRVVEVAPRKAKKEKAAAPQAQTETTAPAQAPENKPEAAKKPKVAPKKPSSPKPHKQEFKKKPKDKGLFNQIRKMFRRKGGP